MVSITSNRMTGDRGGGGDGGGIALVVEFILLVLRRFAAAAAIVVLVAVLIKATLLSNAFSPGWVLGPCTDWRAILRPEDSTSAPR